MEQTEEATIDTSAFLHSVEAWCDRCGSRAFLAVLLPSADVPLRFCRHHGRQHLPALEAIKGVMMLNELDRESV